jgi:aspartyl-tRNA(Asn)/glutamyl-tRNA(Gln) amidotransferase subunit B
LQTGAAISTNDPPNTHTSLFDLALPGSQPAFQLPTLLPALRAAIALKCNIQPTSHFDRKHYFYQDQPAGYQITQYYQPFARDGQITLFDHDGIAPEDGKSITIGIKQVQMEQDTAKSQEHSESLSCPSMSLLDFNRVSHPLIEIVTLPQIHHPTTAATCVRKIQSILQAVNACTTGMEMGGLRADVNVSVKRRGEGDEGAAVQQYYGITGLGQRTEIKNLSSFKSVEDAIIAERDRQIRVLESGGVIEGETRGWAIGSTETRRLRGKEGEVDYRYMPDPDLGPLLIGQDVIDRLEQSLPAMPGSLTKELVGVFQLTMKDAKTLVEFDDGERLEYFRDVVDEVCETNGAAPGPAGKMVGNWVLHELGGLLGTMDVPWERNPVSSRSLAAIVGNLLERRITGTTAKSLLRMKFTGDDRSVEEIVKEENLLLQPLSRDEYVVMAKRLLAKHDDIVQAIRKGQVGKVMFLVGQMMRQGEGRIEASKAEEVLKELIFS